MKADCGRFELSFVIFVWLGRKKLRVGRSFYKLLIDRFTVTGEVICLQARIHYWCT